MALKRAMDETPEEIAEALMDCLEKALVATVSEQRWQARVYWGILQRGLEKLSLM